MKLPIATILLLQGVWSVLCFSAPQVPLGVGKGLPKADNGATGINRFRLGGMWTPRQTHLKSMSPLLSPTVGIPSLQVIPLPISKQVLFISTSILTYAAIIACSTVGISEIFADGYLKPFLKNIPTTTLCFSSADIFSQAIQRMPRSGRPWRPLDFRQTAAAISVGLISNVVGMAVWLHYLDQLIPRSWLGLHASGLMYVLIKAWTHSLVWGTISNSISLVLRRVMTGDSLAGALSFWHQTIFTVTSRQLCFWPAWQSLNFSFVPPAFQIAATALGSFFFNVFMSLITSSHNVPRPPSPRPSSSSSSSSSLSRPDHDLEAFLVIRGAMEASSAAAGGLPIHRVGSTAQTRPSVSSTCAA